MTITHIDDSFPPAAPRAVNITEAEGLGIDFDSAEYDYPVTAGDWVEKPEQAEGEEANHG